MRLQLQTFVMAVSVHNSTRGRLTRSTPMLWLGTALQHKVAFRCTLPLQAMQLDPDLQAALVYQQATHGRHASLHGA